MRAARILMWVAFGLTMVFGLLGGLFSAGYAFEDPGGWAAVGLTAAFVVPIAGLALLSVWRPTVGAWVLAGLVVVVFCLNLVGWFLGPKLNGVGPLPGLSMFGVGVSIGFLGIKRPRLAGLLLVAASVLQLASIVIGITMRSGGGPGEGGGLGAMLGGSDGVIVVPFLILGVLFFVAGALAREPWGFRTPAGQPWPPTGPGPSAAR